MCRQCHFDWELEKVTRGPNLRMLAPRLGEVGCRREGAKKVSDRHEINEGSRSDWPNNLQEPHPVSAAKRGRSFLPNLIFHRRE